MAQENILVYFTGKPHKAVAVEFSQEGLSIAPRERWRVDMGGSPRNGVIVEGKVYLPCRKGRPTPGPVRSPKKGGDDLIVDLRSGKVTGRALFGVDHLTGLVRVGDRLLSLESHRTGAAIVRTYDSTGKQLSESYLGSAPPSPERDALISGWRGSYDWHDGHYHGSFHATPFCQGNRMYVRSRDELICVGPEPASVAAAAGHPPGA
jgi:hypothetical protein